MNFEHKKYRYTECNNLDNCMYCNYIVLDANKASRSLIQKFYNNNNNAKK